MKEFIENVEKYFNKKCLDALDNALALLLSPMDIVEIFYLYYIYQNKPASRDDIMYTLANKSLDEILKFIQIIRNEVSNSLNIG